MARPPVKLRLGILFVLTTLPLLAASAPLSFSFLPTIIAALGFLWFYAAFRRLPSFPFGLAVVLLLFTLWVSLSLSWSIDYELGLRSLISVATIFLSGMVLIAIVPDAKRYLGSRMAAAFLIGLAAAILYLGIELLIWRITGGFILSGFSERRLAYLNRSVAVTGLFLWPAVAAFTLVPVRNKLKPRRWAIAAFFIIYLTFASLSASLTAVAGLVIGASVFGLAWYFRRFTFHLLRALIISGILTAPVLAAYVLPSETLKPLFSQLPGSSKARLCIWHYTAERIFEKPVFGWGFRNSRKVPAAAQATFSHLPACQYPSVRSVIERSPAHILPLHPHNGVLQIWLETGAVGASFLVVLMYLLFRGISRISQGRIIPAIAVGLLTHGLFASVSAYGLWQNWWVGTFWLIAALFMLFAGPSKVRQH